MATAGPRGRAAGADDLEGLACCQGVFDECQEATISGSSRQPNVAAHSRRQAFWRDG